MKMMVKDGDGIVVFVMVDMNVYEKKLVLITVFVRVVMVFTMFVVCVGDMDKFYVVMLGFIGLFFFLCVFGNEFMSVIGLDEVMMMLYNIVVVGACSFGVVVVVSIKYKVILFFVFIEFVFMFVFV